MELTAFVGVRMDERTLQLLDGVAERLSASCPPGIAATRSHAIRHLIVTGSAGVAVPAGTKPPDQEKPMRSG